MTDLHKPVTRKTRADVPHGVKPELVVTLYPGGTIGLREQRRRKEYFLDLGRLYVRAVQSAVAVEKMNKGKERAAERKLRKQLR